MFTYVKLGVPNYFFTRTDEMLEEDYNNLGTTYDDFLTNKFVLLSEEQVAFKEANPNASVKEVFNMELDKPQERTLEDAKREKSMEINTYDNSDSVNSFTLNNEISAWFSVQERLNYQRSVEAALSLDENAKMKFFVGDTLLEVSASLAKRMLSMLQLYADECFIVTKQHKINVEKLETIEEVDNYDYKVGYPQKLNFNLE